MNKNLRIGFDNFIDDRTVRQARNALQNKASVDEMVAHNFAVGRRHYSFEVLMSKLRILLAEATAGT